MAEGSSSSDGVSDSSRAATEASPLASFSSTGHREDDRSRNVGEPGLDSLATSDQSAHPPSSSFSLTGSSASLGRDSRYRQTKLNFLVKKRPCQPSAEYEKSSKVLKATEADQVRTSGSGCSEDNGRCSNTSNLEDWSFSASDGCPNDEEFLEAEAKIEKALAQPETSPDPKIENSSGKSDIVGSPPRLPYYIAEIPHKNLFIDEVPSKLLLYPYFVLFICIRLSTQFRIPISDLMNGMDLELVRSNPKSFWGRIFECLKEHTVEPREPVEVWSAANNSFDGFVFKGKVVFNHKTTHSKHIFNLELESIQAENSCRSERKFGSDRFLYIDIPPFDCKNTKPQRITWEDMKQIESFWYEWRQKKHSFLGRTWQVAYIEPKERTSLGKKERAGTRIVMFATKGAGFPTVSRGDMVNWFFPFKENKEQSFCKAFARLDLGFSRTTPTLVFKPSQIRRVTGIKANGEPEDKQFNDTKFDWAERCLENPVMNDGCARISVGAAIKIWELYKIRNKTNGPMPSVFQARIGGAKGMWLISGEPHSQNPSDLEVWIEISDQQLKFQPPPEDLDDRTYDPIRLTFDICRFSSNSKPATLHSSFIPILVDRHVPWNSITYILTKQLDEERNRLIQLVTDTDPCELYKWVWKELSASQHKDKKEWLAGLPLELPRKILFLLESGLHPAKSPYLANLVHRYIGQHLTRMEEKIRIPLGRSTHLYVVADPLGVLEPGQVYIQFSEPFVDKSTGVTFRGLHGQDVLVSRHPCGRQSDIQKVQAVSCPALSHLVGVVVFSTRGEFPLAAKLQGGDYDGDIVWVCWESTLIENFQNAPAPLNPPNPADYGIKKDTRKLCDIMDNLEPSNSDIFIEEALSFRSQRSMLGLVTYYMEQVAYLENGVDSKEYNALCDIHDLLVDAPKQGFHFTQDDFENYVKQHLDGSKLVQPAYKKAMEKCQVFADSYQANRVEQLKIEYNPGNILDFLYFKVVLENNMITEKKIGNALPLEKEDADPDLQGLCTVLHNERSGLIREELTQLAESFQEIIKKWNSGHRAKGDTFDDYKKVVESCYNDFRSLLPTPKNASHPEIRLLQTHSLGCNQPTPWDMIRASAFYTAYPGKSECVWLMAGKELALLKSGSCEGSRSICNSIAAILRPHRSSVLRIKQVKEETKISDNDTNQAST